MSKPLSTIFISFQCLDDQKLTSRKAMYWEVTVYVKEVLNLRETLDLKVSLDSGGLKEVQANQ